MRRSVAAATALVAAAACGGGGGGGDGSGDSITFVSWGGAYQDAQTKAYLEDYEADTGITVRQDGPTDYARIIAMVESGQVTWDVVDIEGNFGLGESAQYFEPIDYSVVPGDEVIEGLADEYRVGLILYATVIGYNTEEFAEPPADWADFFDPVAFPGTRSLPASANTYVFEVALLADGVAPEDLYPLDVERAVGVLDRIKDDVIFWETGSQSAQQLADGEAVLGMIWNGRIQTAIDEGAPLAIQWNEHVAQSDYLAVPKGAPDPAAAMDLIAYMVSAERNHLIADHIAYAPVNTKTFDLVNPAMAPLLPTFEDRPSLGITPDEDWWDANREEMTEAYNEWMLS
jgi:putative spermidine/putrescine transport system substrate-binding protein